MAKYVEEVGEKFVLNIYTSGSAAPELDGSLAKVDAVSRRYTYQNNPAIREKIDKGFVHYYDAWLGEFGRQLRYGFLDDKCGPIDAAVIEAVGIEEDGSIIPALSVDNTPLFVQLAKKIIIELNLMRAAELKGIHDIYLLKPKEPVPITKVNQRVGSPFIPCNPKKIAAIVASQVPEREVFYGKPTATEEKIVENLFNFLSSEVSKGRLKKSLYPLQTGVGPIGDIVGSKLVESDFNNLEIWTEVAQIGYVDALDAGKVSSISATALYIPPWERGREKNFVET
jgi:succinyl-CoA:acetate CoA-transferase